MQTEKFGDAEIAYVPPEVSASIPQGLVFGMGTLYGCPNAKLTRVISTVTDFYMNDSNIVTGYILEGMDGNSYDIAIENIRLMEIVHANGIPADILNTLAPIGATVEAMAKNEVTRETAVVTGKIASYLYNPRTREYKCRIWVSNEEQFYHLSPYSYFSILEYPDMSGML